MSRTKCWQHCVCCTTQSVRGTVRSALTCMSFHLGRMLHPASRAAHCRVEGAHGDRDREVVDEVTSNFAQAALARQRFHPRHDAQRHREQCRCHGVVLAFRQEEDTRKGVVETQHHIDIGERKLARYEEEVARGIRERERKDEQLGHWVATHEPPPKGKEEGIVLCAVPGGRVALEGGHTHPLDSRVLELVGNIKVGETMAD
mmetsp:Transcript_52885/g.105089  ORF Transcript_52885/g.105089 Transcript_52885/m.105089 type:complete len:202 (-) Transcript_52885:68-673(-)